MGVPATMRQGDGKKSNAVDCQERLHADTFVQQFAKLADRLSLAAIEVWKAQKTVKSRYGRHLAWLMPLQLASCILESRYLAS